MSIKGELMVNYSLKGLVCFLVFCSSIAFVKTMDKYTTHYDFTNNVLNLVGASSISACGANVELDASAEWLCGNFGDDFETFMMRWEEVLNSPSIILNYDVTPTSNWQGNSKTYSFNGDHLVVRFAPINTGQEVSVNVRVNSIAAFKANTPTSATSVQTNVSNSQNLVPTVLDAGVPNEITSATSPNNTSINCINLNTASTYELRLITFIDEDKANEIVLRRDIQAYRSIDELIYVTGIDEAQLSEIKLQKLVCIQ